MAWSVTVVSVGAGSVVAGFLSSRRIWAAALRLVSRSRELVGKLPARSIRRNQAATSASAMAISRRIWVMRRMLRAVSWP